MMAETAQVSLVRSTYAKNYYDAEEQETDDALWLPFREPRRANYSLTGVDYWYTPIGKNDKEISA